ncbi:acyltransferase [Spongiibacter sp. KMU-158]|uniref:Acyltransferase n=1 Tax=Spongiibacter pelagi TaxID=2760804 RepID=A0A927C657_9GAMM|nr:acyltransferase [Spongiibacter pelagi]MBD2860110.1 acyltransferase [Spongiibacter pelagi]
MKKISGYITLFYEYVRNKKRLLRSLPIHARLRANDIRIPVGSYIHPKARIKRGVRINAISYVGECDIGEYCAIAGPIQIRSSNHAIQKLAFQDHFTRNIVELSSGNSGIKKSGGVVLGANCWVGTNVTLLDGASVGHSSIIGAGAVVNRRFPPFSVIGGVPARLIKERYDFETRKLLNNWHWWELERHELKMAQEVFELDWSLDPQMFNSKLMEFFKNNEKKW